MKIAQRSARALGEVVASFGRVREVSNGLLMKIVRDNQDTEYCRKYNFKDIKTVEDFKRNVPFSVFDDYAEYVRREIENGEKDLITVYGVNQYNRSSGTTGSPKTIPMSKVSMDYFTSYVIAVPYGYAALKYGIPSMMGKGLSVVEVVAPGTVAGKT